MAVRSRARAGDLTLRSELADEPDLGLQVLTETFHNAPLRVGDQRSNIRRRGVTEIHHDVGVDV